LLHLHYEQQLQTAVTAGDEDSEADIVENLNNMEITLQEHPTTFYSKM
jgi:hypothetical protein